MPTLVSARTVAGFAFDSPCLRMKLQIVKGPILKNDRPESIVQDGNNNYRFVVSLTFSHPTILPEEVLPLFNIEPKFSVLKGNKRINVEGKPIGRDFRENLVAYNPPINSGDDPQNFAENLIIALTSSVSSKKFCQNYVATQGSIRLFFGFFADGLCDFQLEPETLQILGSLGISLRFDFYGPDIKI